MLYLPIKYYIFAFAYKRFYEYIILNILLPYIKYCFSFVGYLHHIENKFYFNVTFKIDKINQMGYCIVILYLFYVIRYHLQYKSVRKCKQCG